MYKIFSIRDLLDNQTKAFPTYQFRTWEQVVDWFFFECNIPSNWMVCTASEEWLRGEDYEIWKTEKH